MKSLLVVLLMLPTLKAFGATDQYVLKSQGLYCEGIYTQAIENIANAKENSAFKRAVATAIMKGQCTNSGIDVPSLLENVARKTTPDGAIYYCYVQRGQDALRCSDARSVATVAQLQAERTGDFHVVADNDKVLAAKCVEGGRVFIEKGKQWRRTSMIFFGAEGSVQRSVPQDKERVVRDGCKGLDFR